MASQGPDSQTPAPNGSRPANAPVLDVRGLSAGHGSVTVVRNLDLALAAGQVLALLGPNGAGKTTLMTTLAGLLPRKAGDVLVDGRELPLNRPGAANRAGLVLV